MTDETIVHPKLSHAIYYPEPEVEEKEIEEVFGRPSSLDDEENSIGAKCDKIYQDIVVKAR